MQQLNNLSDDADQLLTVALVDGSLAVLEFIYRPTIQRWSLNISHPTLPGTGTINGFNVCLGPNILRQWKNLIPFGIAVTSTNGLDPLQSTDFKNGVVSVFILSAAEVAQVESDILAPIALVNP